MSILPTVPSCLTAFLSYNALSFPVLQVTVSRPGGEHTYSAASVVLTASLNVLASGSIRFTPPLPADKANALARHDHMAHYEVSQYFLVSGLVERDDCICEL